MTEYEVLVETINPCGGDRYSTKEFIDVETDDPTRRVRETGRFPILDVTETPEGDLVVSTGDEAGNRIRYTFTE